MSNLPPNSIPPLYREPWRGTLPEVQKAVASLYARARNGSPAATAEITNLRAKAEAGDPEAQRAHKVLVDVDHEARVSGATWDAARDLYGRLKGGDPNAQAELEAARRSTNVSAHGVTGRAVVGRVEQLQREEGVFRDGPGAPRVGAFPMPLFHRPGVGPQALPRTAASSSPGSRVSMNPQPLPPKSRPAMNTPGSRVSMNPQPLPPRLSKARPMMNRVSGQQLSQAQIQELIIMMGLAANGIGPVASTNPNGGAPTMAAPPGGVGDVMQQLAKAKHDAQLLVKAYQKTNTDPTFLHSVVSMPMNDIDFLTGLPRTKPPVQSAPYTGPSMSDTGVGPNPTWAPGEIQPYAQGGLQGSGLGPGEIDPNADGTYGGGFKF